MLTACGDKITQFYNSLTIPVL